MRSILIIAVSVLAAMASAFALTSYALASDEQRLRSNLPVAGLPASEAPVEDRLWISQLLGTTAAIRYGITAQSYEHVRQIARLSIGRLYLIPGANGACLALREAISCGDPGSSTEQLLALLVRTPDGVMVGGGITTEEMRQVVLTAENRGSHAFPVKNGVFVVRESAKVEPESFDFTVGS